MEAYEQFAALAMSDEGLVVEGGLKFNVRKRTRRKDRAEYQSHGYEVDLVGASRSRLVLASVKSFFGSQGVNVNHMRGAGSERAVKRYAMLNDPIVREGIVQQAADRYGFTLEQVEMRLYVGKFYTGHEQAARNWCTALHVGSGPVQVFGPSEVVPVVRRLAESSQYKDSAVLATIKVLAALDTGVR